MGIPLPVGNPSSSSATVGDASSDEEAPSAEQNEGANPINHQPVQQGETSHETGPIVIASPETLPYNGPAASGVPIPTDPTAASPEEKLTVAVTGSFHSIGSGIVIQGYLENGEGYRRQGLVQIDQDSESPLMTFKTDPTTGAFVVLIDEFDSTTAFVDGIERDVARFFLLPLWMGPEYRPLGEETVIEVSLEGIYFVDEKMVEAEASPKTPPMLWKVETLAEPEEAHKVYVLPVLKPVHKPVHKPFLTLVPLTPKKPHIAETKIPLLIPSSFLPEEEPEDHPLPTLKPLWFEGVKP